MALADYKALDETGNTDLCDEWAPLVRAIEGMAAVYQAKVTGGSAEPDDTLTGWIFGENPLNTWKVESVSGTLDFDENTNTPASPTWTRRFAINTANVVADVPLQVPAGSAAAPGLAIGGATNGLSLNSSTLEVDIAGTAVASFRGGDSQLRFATGWTIQGEDGLASAPGFGFRADASGAGMYRKGTGELTLVVGGADILRADGTTVQYLDTIQAPLSGVTTPAYNFTGATTTGLGADADEVSLVLAGTPVLRCFSGVISTPLLFRTADGTQAFPAYSFTSDVDTGLYITSPGNELAIGFGNSEKLRFGTGGITASDSILGIQGADSNVSYAFESDATSGLYLDSVGVIGVAIGNIEVFTIDSGGLTFGAGVGLDLDGGTIVGDATGGVGGGPAISTTVGGVEVSQDGCPGAFTTTTTLVSNYPGGHVFLVGDGTTNLIPAAAEADNATHPALGRLSSELAVPSLAHAGDVLTGFIWDTVGGGTLSVIVTGNEIGQFQVTNSNGNAQSFFAVPGGWWYAAPTAVRPGLSSYGDEDTGLMWGHTYAGGSADELYMFAGGQAVGYWHSTGFTLAGYTNGDSASGFTSRLFLDSNDGVSNPGLTWDGDTNTGIYSAAADTVSITTNSAQRGSFTNTGFRCYDSSSTTTPPLSFLSHTDTGLAVNDSGNNDYLSVVAQAAEILRLNGNVTDTEFQVLLGAGTNRGAVGVAGSGASRPSIAAVGNTNTGISWGPDSPVADKNIRIAVGGGTVAYFGQDGLLAWPSQIRTRMLATADALSAATPFTVTWDTEDYNGGGDTQWVVGTPTRITAQLDGTYYIAFNADFDTSGAGATVLEAFVRIDGTTDSGIGEVTRVASAGSRMRLGSSDMIMLTANQYIELIIESSAASVTADTTSLTMIRVNDDL